MGERFYREPLTLDDVEREAERLMREAAGKRGMSLGAWIAARMKDAADKVPPTSPLSERIAAALPNSMSEWARRDTTASILEAVGETDETALCEGCGKPIRRGQFVHCYDDAVEVHVDCENPNAFSDDPSAVVLVGDPLVRRAIERALSSPAVGEALLLLGELIGTDKSAEFYGIGDVLRAKLQTIELTLQPTPPHDRDTISQWQPIETAPKDGKSIWAAQVYASPFVPRYFEARWSPPISSRSEGRWHDLSANRWAYPTHWQPLPAPPALKETPDGP